MAPRLGAYPHTGQQTPFWPLDSNSPASQMGQMMD
jgi:hypothetical protein